MSYGIHVLDLAGIYVVLALSLNLVAGYSGLLSLCHAAFYGIGAYGVALTTTHFGLPLPCAFACAMLATASLAAIVGAASSRFRGDYFIIATFALQILVFSLLNNVGILTEGPDGIAGVAHPRVFGKTLSNAESFAGLLFPIVTGVVIAAFVADKSQFVRMLRTIREDETYARSIGIGVTAFKVAAFSISGAIAGLAGGLYATYVSYVDPTSFTFAESLAVLSMVIVGGLGSPLGVIFGAILLAVVPEALRAVGIQGSAGGNIRQMLYGCGLIGMLFLRPTGLIGERRAQIP